MTFDDVLAQVLALLPTENSDALLEALLRDDASLDACV
jgi:hypothetical protein